MLQRSNFFIGYEFLFINYILEVNIRAYAYIPFRFFLACLWVGRHQETGSTMQCPV